MYCPSEDQHSDNLTERVMKPGMMDPVVQAALHYAENYGRESTRASFLGVDLNDVRASLAKTKHDAEYQERDAKYVRDKNKDLYAYIERLEKRVKRLTPKKVTKKRNK